MTYQRLLIRLFSLPVLRVVGRRLLDQRTWTIEEGPGAGLKLHYPQNYDYIVGQSEPPVQREIAKRLKPGDVFYDVGANMGFFSLIAGRLVGNDGCVCAFEPHPENAPKIVNNAALNHMEHLRVFQVAVGGTARLDELLMTEWDGGGTLSEYPYGPASSVTRTRVRVTPLDQFIPENKLPLPTFVKIDVEGAELEVIDGMKQTIAESKPILLYEVDDGDRENFERRWAELDEKVSAMGYDIFHLDNAYPGINWHVGHSLAVPTGIAPQNRAHGLTG